MNNLLIWLSFILLLHLVRRQRVYCHAIESRSVANIRNERNAWVTSPRVPRYCYNWPYIYILLTYLLENINIISKVNDNKHNIKRAHLKTMYSTACRWTSIVRLKSLRFQLFVVSLFGCVLTGASIEPISTNVRFLIECEVSNGTTFAINVNTAAKYSH